MSLSSLCKRDLIDLLEKASVLLDTVITECPDDNDLDDMDSPFTFLVNAAGDIQDAINLLEQE